MPTLYSKTPDNLGSMVFGGTACHKIKCLNELKACEARVVDQTAGAASALNNSSAAVLEVETDYHHVCNELTLYLSGGQAGCTYVVEYQIEYTRCDGTTGILKKCGKFYVQDCAACAC